MKKFQLGLSGLRQLRIAQQAFVLVQDYLSLNPITISEWGAPKASLSPSFFIQLMWWCKNEAKSSMSDT